MAKKGNSLIAFIESDLDKTINLTNLISLNNLYLQKSLFMERAILEQNPHWKDKEYQNLKERICFEPIKNNLKVKHIQILTGIRRSGKSSIF